MQMDAGEDVAQDSPKESGSWKTIDNHIFPFPLLQSRNEGIDFLWAAFFTFFTPCLRAVDVYGVMGGLLYLSMMFTGLGLGRLVRLSGQAVSYESLQPSILMSESGQVRIALRNLSTKWAIVPYHSSIVLCLL